MKGDDEVWLITVIKQKSDDKIAVGKLRFTGKVGCLMIALLQISLRLW